MSPPKQRLRFWQGRRRLNLGHAADLEQTKPIRQQTSRQLSRSARAASTDRRLGYSASRQCIPATDALCTRSHPLQPRLAVVFHIGIHLGRQHNSNASPRPRPPPRPRPLRNSFGRTPLRKLFLQRMLSHLSNQTSVTPPELDSSFRRGRRTSSPWQFRHTNFICSAQLPQ
jgi:hypothetical protein